MLTTLNERNENQYIKSTVKCSHKGVKHSKSNNMEKKSSSFKH